MVKLQKKQKNLNLGNGRYGNLRSRKLRPIQLKRNFLIRPLIIKNMAAAFLLACTVNREIKLNLSIMELEALLCSGFNHTYPTENNAYFLMVNLLNYSPLTV